jgi:hypothetical protein
VEELARVLVGLLFAALVLALVTEGWSGVGRWLSSKFLGSS